jgi:hypothetical protein
MELEELFNHALTTLPEAVSDILRDGRDPGELVFASFDGASELGIALIASDLSGELGVEAPSARDEVERMVQAASLRGEELVVSLMVTKDVLSRILAVSNVDVSTRLAVRLWLDGPLPDGHFRVVAVGQADVRAAVVDGATDMDEAPPISRSMLN